jgi:glycosyltransferase involved in cell wall biosynthesis
VPVSVLIPVKNEQANIVECIRHVLWANHIAVIDSQSSDETIALAQAMGAEVYQFHYSKQGWPKKKNWALEHVPWRNEWVLIVDADEHMTPELTREIVEVVAPVARALGSRLSALGDGSDPVADSRQLTADSRQPTGYWLNRRFMFMNRWIKHCGYYPSWNIRLLRHDAGRYERIGNLGDTGSGDNEVHEHIVLSRGEAGYLKHDFLHYAYPNLTTWVEKHNRYSTWEAHAMDAKDEGGITPSLVGGPIARRRWIKAMTRRLPLRPFMRFLYSYIIRGGILDGYPGFVMCRLLAWYEFISIAKYREMQNVQKRDEAATSNVDV